MNSHHTCQTLQVSRSGFYAYLKRRLSSKHVENEALNDAHFATIEQVY
ncbi:TPA: hypothetical protein VMX25_001473 [Streptococcus pyogenes]|nr:hypothetical protein HMPREF1230_1002 [Streptococcus pyogenes GA19681]ESA46222.1 hypothetical protein HMPREF1234_0603 [Streptococcus pyogenes GA41039]HER2765514.1 hypothetical protein [Streptococcus pyogenes]HER8869633.1 hypothetical protein [Streptococcus pyogenes]